MAQVTENSTLTAVSGATGVEIEATIDVGLLPSGGPYSQLYLEDVTIEIQRSTNGINFTTINTTFENIVFNSLAYNEVINYTDTSAVSGTTYQYRVLHDVNHFEEAGVPQ